MKILIISEYIAPVNTIGAIRWTKLGKYLSQNYGCTVDVLTTRKDFDHKDPRLTQFLYDETIATDLQHFNQVLYIPNGFFQGLLNRVLNKGRQSSFIAASASSTKKQSGKRVFLSNIRKTLINKVHDLFFRLYDCANARSGIRTNIDWQEYDFIISTYGPCWPGLVAGKVKQRCPNIIWIADYRDAPASTPEKLTRYDKRFINLVLKWSDCILVVSEGEKPFVDPDGSAAKLFVVTNGYDDEELSARCRKSEKKFIVSYTGTLYNMGISTSNLRPLLCALEDLAAQKKIAIEDLEIVYCGNSAKEFESQIASYPSLSYKNRGMVERSEALEIQGCSSLLAMCTWNTTNSQGNTTGKIYEYLTSGVPIICLCSGDLPNSNLKKMIEGSGTGFCYEEPSDAQDFPALMRFVEEKYNEWQQHGITTMDARDETIKQYGYSSISEKLHGVLSDCLKQST